MTPKMNSQDRSDSDCIEQSANLYEARELSLVKN